MDLVSLWLPLIMILHLDLDSPIQRMMFVTWRACTRIGRGLACLFGISFDYLICPYTFSLPNYFVRGSVVQPRIKKIGAKGSTLEELQHILH